MDRKISTTVELMEAVMVGCVGDIGDECQNNHVANALIIFSAIVHKNISIIYWYYDEVTVWVIKVGKPKGGIVNGVEIGSSY